jgi:hypothetical protein
MSDISGSHSMKWGTRSAYDVKYQHDLRRTPISYRLNNKRRIRCRSASERTDQQQPALQRLYIQDQ